MWVTPAVQAELEWLAGEGPPKVARHARIILSHTAGRSTRTIAADVGVHPNTVRNCVRRFEARGLQGLVHGSAGKPKNVAFSEAVRDAIARVALQSPTHCGELYTQWSLRRLRGHLVRRGVVAAISVEGVRQLIGSLPLPAAYWRRSVRPANSLTPQVREALERMAAAGRRDRQVRARIVLAASQGLNEAEIADAVRVGRGPVRRWLRRFRRAGILGLQALPGQPALAAPVRAAILRMAASDPRRYGVSRPRWSLQSLQTALIRRRVVRAISIAHLRRILREAHPAARTATTTLRETTAPR